MTSTERFARNLRALAHYRPSQVLHRVAIHARRRLVGLAPGRQRRRLARLAQSPPPARRLSCPDHLREFVMDPEVAPAERAEDLLRGRFSFLGRTLALGERPDWLLRGADAPPHLWRMNLHYHRFLVDAAAAALRDPGGSAALLERAAGLLDDWSRACVVGSPGTWDDAWNSYSASTRLLNGWLARRLLTAVRGEPAAALARRLDSLGASTAEFLASWLERDLGGNHLLRNATALVAAGRWFTGAPAANWRSLGRRLLLHELERQVLSDGLHEERSPMYHALLLEDLLLAGLAQAPDPDSAEPALRPWASKLAAALTSVLHPDGQIALFNDGALGIAAPPRSLLALAAADGLSPPSSPPGDLPAAGYFRFAEDADVLLFDAGLLGPDHLPAHAHCDALSFEYSAGGRRLVVDTGVDRYQAGPERDFQRSTAAHSTLQIEDREQAEPFGSFRIGRRPRVRGRRLDERTVEGEHDGFRPAGLHRRRLVWNGARGFSWVDSVEGPREVEVTVRLGLAPRVEARVGADDAVLRQPDGSRFELRVPPGGTLSLDGGVYCERFGSSVRRGVVCWRGRAGRGRELPFALRRQD